MELISELECIGSGGFGSVYRAMNVLDGQQYAIKKVLLSNYEEPDDFELENECLSVSPVSTLMSPCSAKDFDSLLSVNHRLLREVKTLASVSNHPNIVRYYNAWIEPVNERENKSLVDEDLETERAFATLYIQMQLYPCQDLRSYLETREGIDVEVNQSTFMVCKKFMLANGHGIVPYTFQRRYPSGFQARQYFYAR